MGKRYDDKFRAGAIVMLEAAGYPDKPGALVTVAKNLNMPHQTLSRWARSKQNPPPPEVVQEKRLDLVEALLREVGLAFKEMDGARPDADYRALVTAVGIMVDKLQLLTGQATEIHEHNINDAREAVERRIAGLARQFGQESDIRQPDAPTA